MILRYAVAFAAARYLVNYKYVAAPQHKKKRQSRKIFIENQVDPRKQAPSE